MTFEISGEHNTATVHTNKEKEACEDGVIDQIQEMVDHEAFYGDDDVTIMPDFHYGAGAVIGFTMPLKDRVVPNTIGRDIGCFHPDTMVDTVSGSVRIEDLANRDSSFGVYSCDNEGNIKIGEATAMKTRKNSELLKVKIDNGETIKCTPDHEFMLRNGEYREAQNLSSGDSLMPLYKGETDDGYKLVFDNNMDKSHGKREHWMVARSELMDIPRDIDNIVIHHKDFDKKNNSPDNLKFMSREEHSKLHANMRQTFDGDNSEFEEKRIRRLNEYWENLSDEELKEKRETARDNIVSWMNNNPDEFKQSVSDNGERGKKYLIDFNTSKRSCQICDETFENPAKEYWHEVKTHPDETEYEIRENHSVESVDKIDETSDVYCLNVPRYGNFALSAGVIVHNCGMLALNFGRVNINLDSTKNLRRIDKEVRSRIPMGFNVHNSADYHMKNDFPWHVCTDKLKDFEKSTDFEFDEPEYDASYLNELCNRVGYDVGRAINSVGTLGGGNHFIELGKDENNSLWAVIHSGSRGIGGTIAGYWQGIATERTTTRYSIDDVPKEVREYMNESWNPRSEKIRNDFSGENIQNKFDEVSQAIQEYGPSAADRNTDLDYLEGDEASGYIKDMIFAQTYASESRREMGFAVAKALASVAGSEQEYLYKVNDIESIHNYIDPEDGMIRKGACSAKEGERLVVPFNMEYGTIITEGKGKDSWNKSSAHGAGRAMSRTAAKKQFTEDDFDDQTDGVFMTKQPLGEIPGAYKSPENVENALGGNVEIINRIDPILSIKAD